MIPLDAVDYLSVDQQVQMSQRLKEISNIVAEIFDFDRNRPGCC